MTMARSGGGSDYDYIFKLVLIGDPGVGKSNLLLRFTRDEFRLGTQTTLGVEFAYRQLVIDGKKVKNQIWDTAGQDRFKSVIPQLYRGCEGIFVVFDLTKSETFDHVTRWMEDIHQHTPPDLPIILIGNKSDLDNRRKVTCEQAVALARQLNVSYMETSALNASNVEKAFTTLVTNIYQKNKSKLIAHSSPIDRIAPGPSKTIPILSGPIDETSSGPNSFRLKPDEEFFDTEKKNSDGGGGRCCKNA